MDRHTVDQLVVQHLPVALRLARRLAGDAGVAEEIVQEALCRVLRGWRQYRGEAAFSTWMMQIVVNVDRDRRRRRREHEPLVPDRLRSSEAEPGEHAAATELQAAVRAAIEALPDRQREVALLSFGEGLKAGQIATILEITEANVHTCIHLARKRIAEVIGISPVRRRSDDER